MRGGQTGVDFVVMVLGHGRVSMRREYSPADGRG